MAKVMCFHCKKKSEKSEMYQAKIGSMLKNFCNEQCYINNREPVEYRKKVIGLLYSILNIKFQDGGSLINKKLKELDSYEMKYIYQVMCENEFDIQMYTPTSGPLHGRLNYVFSIIKNRIYESENKIENKQVEVKQVETVIEHVEEVYTPMKKPVRKAKQNKNEELTIDF